MNKFTYKIVIRKDRPLANGEHSICLLLIYSRKNKRVSLNISARLKDWDEKNERVKKGDPDSEKKNKLITVYKNRISEYETKCIVKNKPFILENAVNCITGNLNEESFYDYLKKEWPNYKASLKPNTFKKYQSHLNVIKGYKRKLLFSEIDAAFLRAYETYLTTKRSNGKNTISKALKWIKTIFNQAVRDGIVEKSPFENYKISNDPGHREHLSMNELGRLENIYYQGKLRNSMQETLRAFLFCAYTGLRLSDMKDLSYSCINEDILTTIMNKTDHQVSVPLISNAKRLLVDGGEDKVFSTVSDQMINKHLKKIMPMAKIEKKITFHCARHTFATLSLNLGVPKDSVQKILGHTDIKTTDIYTQYEVSLLQKGMKKWEKRSRNV
ncbi:MAG: Tyrosine recombinase XerC [Peptostreptococcus russellii]